MRRSRAQPKHTRLPRLHDATPHDRPEPAPAERTVRAHPTRVSHGKNFRLRTIRPD